jgi:uncharacterized RDD family membrane protein YckC
MAVPSKDFEAEVLGLDNVRLELPVAGAGSRILAAIVDHLLISLGALFILVGAVLIAAWVEQPELIFIIGGIGFFLINTAYFCGFEIALDGRTPGKKMVGLRTVSQLGGRASNPALILRNLVRPFDYLFGTYLMIFDRRARRFGDLLASTLVVYHRDSVALRPTVGRVPAGWGPHEVALVENFLERSPLLEPGKAESLARDLLEAVDRRDPTLLDTTLPPLPEALLELQRRLAVVAT